MRDLGGKHILFRRFSSRPRWLEGRAEQVIRARIFDLGTQGGKFCADLGEFGFELRISLRLVTQVFIQRVALRFSVGERALRGAQRGLRCRERRFRLGEFRTRSGFGIRIIGAERGQFFGFAVEPPQHRGGILDQSLLAAKIGIHLRDAPFKFGQPRFGAALFTVKRFARQNQFLQFAAGTGLGFAQGRQFMRCDSLQTRRLGLMQRRVSDEFQIVFDLLSGGGNLCIGFAEIDERKQGLVTLDVGGEDTIARRLARLTLQPVDLRLDLLHHVFETHEIIFGPLQPKLRLMPARIQPGDAGGLFENAAPLLRLDRDEFADLSLPHHGGRARARGRVGKQQLHVAGTDLAAVDAKARSRHRARCAG